MRLFLKRLRAKFPRQLPTGMTSFNAWVADIIAVSGLPDNSSTRQLAGQFILSMAPSIGSIPLQEIANRMVKAAANQVAAEALETLKSEAKEATTTPIKVV
jgi:hypothetical protein